MVPVIDPGRRSPSSVIWRSTLLRCASSPGSVSDIGDTSSTLSVLYTFRQEAQKKATPHILTPVSRAHKGKHNCISEHWVLTSGQLQLVAGRVQDVRQR